MINGKKAYLCIQLSRRKLNGNMKHIHLYRQISLTLPVDLT